MTDIKETIQGLYALKTYLSSKTIEEHGPARESLIGGLLTNDIRSAFVKVWEELNERAD